jgi:ribosomal protein S1
VRLCARFPFTQIDEYKQKLAQLNIEPVVSTDRDTIEVRVLSHSNNQICRYTQALKVERRQALTQIAQLLEENEALRMQALSNSV